MSSTDNYGPLSLQIGSVTGAVDDLVHGYEQLVHSLPNLTSQVANVHADTEEMAKQLEHRTRSLVDGYEYLQGLSTQLPDMFRETASAHRKTLQDAIYLLTPEEKAKIADQQHVLDKVRCELQSISHERAIMDVLMRPTINETRRLYMQTQSTADRRSDQNRHAHNLGIGSYNSASKQQVATTTSRTPVTTRSNNTQRTTPANMQTGNPNPASSNHAVDFLNSPIPIPDYDPNQPATEKNRSAATGSGHYMEYPQTNPFSEPRLVARAVGGALMVPNMRRGALPSEVQALRTLPTAAVTAAEYMEAEMQRRLRVKRRKVRRTAPKVVTLEKESLAKSLAEKLEHTDDEVSSLKKRFASANHKFNADQKAAISKLQAVVRELQEGQGGRDEALLSAVQKLLQESLSSGKQPENRDAEILRALESLLVPPKRVAVIDRLHEYKVMTARAKTEVHPPPLKQAIVPVIAPVEAPKEVFKPISVEVQTEPVPTPEEPPTPVPAPAPAPVIVNVPAPPAPVSMERDLIELMRSVVESQQQTMQGNQALILSLIHERNTHPEPVQLIAEEEDSIVNPIPPRAPSPEPIAAPEPEPVSVIEATKPAYSTAFGSVVLGGELMIGPYTTPATVIPTALQPCVLRGVPHPISRRTAAPPVNGPTEGNSEEAATAVESIAVKADDEEEKEQDEQAKEEEKPAADGSSNTAVIVQSSPAECTFVSDALQNDEGNAAGLQSSGVSSTAGRGGSQQNDEGVAVGLQSSGVSSTAGRGDSQQNDEGVAVGLQSSGVSSTAGRGGSQQHSTPGQTHEVDPARIPPHMRRVASDFTMRALRSTPSTTTPTAISNTVYTTTQQAVGAQDPSSNPKNQPELLTLLQNIHTLSTQNVGTSPATVTVTPELIAQKVSEGVQLGVKEALGLLETHTEHRSYYHPAAADTTHSARHQSTTLSSRQHAHRPPAGLASTSQTVYVSATDKPDDKMRDSLVLLKSRRGGGRPIRTKLEREEEGVFQERAQCLTSRQLPHRPTHRRPAVLRNSSELEDHHHPQQCAQQQQEHKNILQEVEFSRKYTQKLLNMDENSSFNDSVSLDEDTAAFLRDPLTLSNDHGFTSSVSASTDLSCDGNPAATGTASDGVHKNLRLIYRNVHEKRHSDVFSNTQPPLVRTDLRPRHEHAPVYSNSSSNPAPSVGIIVPLISHVLYQSATEEALQRNGGIGAGTVYDSVDGAHTVYDSAEGAHTVRAGSVEGSADAALWDLNTSALRPTAPTGRTTTAGNNLRLLQHQTDMATAAGGLPSAVLSSCDSASIVTASTSDASKLDEPELSPCPTRRSPVSRLPIRQSGSSGSGRSVNSSCCSSSDFVSSYDSSVAPSAGIYRRHSEHRHISKLPLRSASSMHHKSHKSNLSPPSKQQYHTTDPGATASDTDRLAAEMMLTALDLHRPGNYNTRPHLHNLVSTYLPKSHTAKPYTSRIYAVDSENDVESDNNSVHNSSIEDELNYTGSSCSSEDELLERVSHPRGNTTTAGIKLMGVGTTRKMLHIRK